MTAAWWIESLWRTAAVLGVALGAYLVARGTWGLLRVARGACIDLLNRWWYALPAVQRRVVRRWQAEVDSGKATRRDLVAGARALLRTVDATGRRDRYRILTEFLEPIAGEQA